MNDKQVRELSLLYSAEYEKKHGHKPRVNSYRDKWGYQSMIDDLGFDEAVAVIQYYFKTSGPHSPERLFRSYDQLSERHDEIDRDKIRIAELMRQTAERVKRWEQNHGTDSR